MKQKIDKSNVQEILELSGTQQGMLYHFLKEPEAHLYNVQLSFRVKGDLNIDILKESFAMVQSQNEVLRAVFRWENVSKPIQIILKDCPADFEFHDLSFLSEEEKAIAVKKYATTDRVSRFDLHKLPVKFHVIMEQPGSFWLNITYHHILHDGWSNGILFKELFFSYRELSQGRVPVFKTKPAYKKIIQGLKNSIDEKEKKAFWAAYLDNYEFKHHPAEEGLTQEVKQHRVQTAIEGLDDFVRNNRVTKAAVIYAAYSLLLLKYNATHDIVFGTTVSGRGPSIPGSDAVIGNFINLIPMRVTVNADLSLMDLVKQLNNDMIKRNPYHNSSLHEINQMLDLDAGNNLFKSVLGIENYPLDHGLTRSIEGLDIQLDAVYENTNADMVTLAFFREHLELEFNYKSSVLTDTFIHEFSARLEGLIHQILTAAETKLQDLSLLSAAEQARILVDFNQTAHNEYSGKNIVSLFEEQVSRTPDKVAVVCGQQSLTYRKLNAEANRLAGYLRLKAGPERQIIALSAQPSAEMIIGMLAILKSGAAYLPVNPEAPDLWVKGICREAQCSLLLTQGKNKRSAIDGTALVQIEKTDTSAFSEDNLELPVTADQLAYVIYTSGSTGTPKGVMISHENLCNYACWFKNFIQLNEADKTALTTSFAFDLGYTVIYPALLFGAELHLPAKELYSTPYSLLSYIETNGLSFLKVTPSFYANIVDHPDFAKMKNVRVIIIGGEKISAEAVSKTYSLLKDTAVVNHYGPTETTIGAVADYIDRDGILEFKKQPFIGKPIANTKCYILDAWLQPVPVGISGELYISGKGVGQGYLQRDDLTAARFISSPFEEGEKMYRTGDIAHWLPDGHIAFVARADEQVKVRGYRIEPNEIEHQLLGHDGITETIVMVKQEVLCAFYLARKPLQKAELLNFLSERLPEYMIPSYFIHLNAWPLTANGKLDRKALPDPEITTKVLHEAPADEIEEKLLDIWVQILGLKKESISVLASFFDLGGHSMKVILMLSRIHKQLNVLIPINEMFQLRTIRALAESIRNKEQITYVPIPRAAVKGYYRLSSAQRRLYFLYEYDRDSTAYNGLFTRLLKGKVDKDVMEDCFRKLIARHEILRTSFLMIDNEPMQEVSASVDFNIETFASGKQTPEEILKSFVRPFDLSIPCQMRVALIRINEDEYLFAVDAHHIIGDGVSQELLIKEFMDLLNGRALPALRIQYKDFVEWQGSARRQAKIDEQKDFWLKEFATLPDMLELPADFQRPLVNEYAGAEIAFGLDEEITGKLRTIAEKEGVTLFMLLLAAYNVLLAKTANQEDITVGIATAGREHPDVENVLGMFVNTIPVRNNADGMLAFRELLSAVKTKVLKCLENQDYPYEELIDDLKIARTTGRNPLFDVMFTFQSFKEARLEMPGIELSAFNAAHHVSKFDMTLIAFEKDKGISLAFEYSTQLFSAATMLKFTQYFKRIIDAAVTDIHTRIADIDILSEQERRQLLLTFNETTVAWPEGATIVSLFRNIVAEYPAATALVAGDKRMSYQELQHNTDAVKALIREKLADSKGQRIGLLFTASAEMIVCILAVMQSGNVFVPLATDNPDERNRFILQDSEVKLLLVESKIYTDTLADRTGMDARLVIPVDSAQLPLIQDEETATGVVATDPVYVIYTSGTTGQPKGVEVTHANLVNYTLWRISQYGLTAEDKALQLVPYYFDGFGSNCYATLLSGGTLVLIEDDRKLDAPYVASVIREEGITNFAVLPRLYVELLPYLNNKLPLRLVILAGEKAAPELAATSRKLLPGVNLENEYGPTETTVAATHHDNLNESNVSVIGKPIANTVIYIVGKNNELLPLGSKGEICIGGRGVTPGYINNEALQQEKFVTDIFNPGERLYKTGDCGRWLSDGNIEIIDRLDNQIKIRGFRIELGEIERNLAMHESVGEAVVITIQRNDTQYLAAYYTATRPLSASDLDLFLSERLPRYMIPSFYHFMERFPYTAAGKLLKTALPDIGIDGNRPYVAPRSKVEMLLCQVWENITGEKHISITDNFFAIGGDSIKSIQICSRMRNAGYELTVKDIFAAQTIQELAIRVKPLVTLSEQTAISGTTVPGPIHRWFFSSGIKNRHHFNQSVMLGFASGIAEEDVKTIFRKLYEHHDALRMTVSDKAEIIQHDISDSPELLLRTEDLRHVTNPQLLMDRVVNEVQQSIQLENGPLIKLALFQEENGSRLLIVIHHLVVDGISWRILLEDIGTLYRNVRAGRTLKLPYKTDPYLSWPGRMQEYAASRKFEKASAWWDRISIPADARIPLKFPEAVNTVAMAARELFTLDEEATENLLKKAHMPFNTQVNELLLAALLLSVRSHYGVKHIAVDIESHGREELGLRENYNRTMGWFTAIYPVVLTTQDDSYASAITYVKEIIRHVPDNGIDYLIRAGAKAITPNVSFNYLGDFDAGLDDSLFTVSTHLSGSNIDTTETRLYDWEISAMAANRQLSVSLTYGSQQFSAEEMKVFMQRFEDNLRGIIQYCSTSDESILTPSDLTWKELTLAGVNALQQRFLLKDVYTLSPMQEGLLFHARLEPASDSYFEQMVINIKGNLDVAVVKKTLQDLVARYDILRTVFIHNDGNRPFQVVLKEREPVFEYIDIRALCADNGRLSVIKSFQESQRKIKFNPEQDVLLRVLLLRSGEDTFELIWAHHHIIMDGWCMGIILKDFRELYALNKREANVLLPATTPYAAYISWLEGRDKRADLEYWRTYLQGYNEVSSLQTKRYPEEINREYNPATHSLIIGGPQADAIRQAVRTLGITMNAMIQCAWAILLSRYNHTNDVVFGAVVSGRPANIPGVETMVGLFMNTVPVRISWDQDAGIQDLLRQAHDSFAESEQHAYITLSEIQAQSSLGRNLLDHIIVFENYPLEEELGNKHDAAEFLITGVSAFEQNNYNLWLSVIDGEQIRVRFNFNRKMYSEKQIAQVAAQFSHVMGQLATGANGRVAETDILPAEERELLLNSFNDTACPYPTEDTVVSLFEKQVMATPDEVAIVCGNESITYRELNERANALAVFLREEYNIQPDELIAIRSERSVAMMTGLLAIMKAGAAYVPLDPAYPGERISYILKDCEAKVMLTSRRAKKADFGGAMIDIETFQGRKQENISPVNKPSDLCYVIYTSGTTGHPKGVMLSHTNVVSFFTAMDQRLHPDKDDCMLAVTSISFDISVLELFWTLCSGIQVVIHPTDIAAAELNSYLHENNQPVDFSLFFFSSYSNTGHNKYQLLMDSVQYADREQFTAVWTPERHFHEFGGLYPNPSVLSAAIAMVTKSISIRSGSIVAPLHDAIRVAEDWSVVDNLSNGRVALSFASGWNPNDFILSSTAFDNRYAYMYQQIAEVKRLWKGEKVVRKNGQGKDVAVRIFPEPIQQELPVWITSARSEASFSSAGAARANILTHFLGQDLTELEYKINLYRKAREENGHDRNAGKVTVMLHTYIGDEQEEVESIVEEPFTEYLKSSIGLGTILLEEAGMKEEDLSADDLRHIVKNAFRRYCKTSSLIGTKETCAEMVKKLRTIGVNEIACLIDFGLEESLVMESLSKLKELKDLFASPQETQQKLHKPVTMMQSTPSFIKLLEADAMNNRAFLASLNTLLVGGEAVSADLVNKFRHQYKAEIYNMYGPTETTIWSAVHHFDAQVDTVSIGRPIANTRIYVLDANLRLLPCGVPGDLCIAGKGVSRGYWKRPALTADKFVQDPYMPDEVMYKTGDIAKWTPDGLLEVMGRDDQQVKIRGYRIEPGEIESVLLASGLISECAVVPGGDESKYLAAYLVSDEELDMTAVKQFLRTILPEFMIPSFFIQMDKLPLTPNGKIDRKALPDPRVENLDITRIISSETQQQLVEIWSEVLKTDQAAISTSRSFFDMGGHSLNATMLINKVYKTFDVRIPLQKIFVLNSIELIAEYIENEHWLKQEVTSHAGKEIILD